MQTFLVDSFALIAVDNYRKYLRKSYFCLQRNVWWVSSDNLPFRLIRNEQSTNNYRFRLPDSFNTCTIISRRAEERRSFKDLCNHVPWLYFTNNMTLPHNSRIRLNSYSFHFFMKITLFTLLVLVKVLQKKKATKFVNRTLILG